MNTDLTDRVRHVRAIGQVGQHGGIEKVVRIGHPESVGMSLALQKICFACRLVGRAGHRFAAVKDHRRPFWPIVLACTFFLAQVPASAVIFKWVDEKGTVHFSHVPPPDGDRAAALEVRGETAPKPMVTGVPPRENSDEDSEERHRQEQVPPPPIVREEPQEDGDPPVIVINRRVDRRTLIRARSPLNQPGQPVRDGNREWGRQDGMGGRRGNINAGSAANTKESAPRRDILVRRRARH